MHRCALAQGASSQRLLDEQIQALMPVVIRNSNHLSTNTNKTLDKIR